MLKLVVLSFAFSMLILSGAATAATLGTPSITAPSDGSSYEPGETFTLSSTINCGGSSGRCRNTDLTVELPSGLSTSDSNPQSCGHIDAGDSCSKSWTISADSVGTYSITVLVETSNLGSATSSPIDVTVEVEEEVGAGEEADSSSSSSSSDDDSATLVGVEILSPGEGSSFKRGDSVFVKASTQANLLVKANLGSEVQLFDDGKHDDGGFHDGIYANTIVVPMLQNGPRDLKVEVDENNYFGEATVEVVINTSLKIVPEFNGSYSQGDEIDFKAKVLDSNDMPVADASVEINAKLKDFGFTKEAETGGDGTVDEKYVVSFFDPLGNWSVNISATDAKGNTGYVLVPLAVGLPSGGISYTAKFANPLPTLTYNRGDSIPIYVEVFESGKTLSGASVSVKTNDGEIIPLKESVNGSYIGEYIIKFDDSLEDFSLSVIATKSVEGKVRGGGNKIDLVVEPAKLKMEVLTPEKSSYTVGESVKITTRALYPDGTLGTGLAVTAKNPLNESVALKEIEPGTYQATYKLRDGDEGPWLVSVEAIDAVSNSGELKKLIQVAPITPFYLVVQYWYLLAAGLAPVGYYIFRTSTRFAKSSNEKNMEEELHRLVKMKKEAQIKYFKEGSITKDSYENMMEKYEEKEHDIKAKLSHSKDKK